MTASPIPAVVPGRLPSGRRGAAGSASSARRAPLPLARLAPDNGYPSGVYRLAAIDYHGRINDKTVPRALDWPAGTRLAMREEHGWIVVHADPRGVFAVTGQGYLQLPAAVRHWCGLNPGDRVLLAADPAAGRLVVHPPAEVEAMVTAAHAAAWGGEAS